IFDTSRCMFCNLCSEACPTDCLELTQSFELAVYHRSGFCWDREMLEKGINYVRYAKKQPAVVKSRLCLFWYQHTGHSNEEICSYTAGKQRCSTCSRF